jgi:hypothetical protein
LRRSEGKKNGYKKKLSENKKPTKHHLYDGDCVLYFNYFIIIILDFSTKIKSKNMIRVKIMAKINVYY